MNNGDGFSGSPPPALTTSSPVKQYSAVIETEPSPGKTLGAAPAGPAAWGYFDGSNTAGPAFGDEAHSSVASPFVGVGAAGGPHRAPGSGNPVPVSRPIARTGSSVEENILVMLMPEKEGVFMFQHHNYEVASHRRGSKVIRRYSDFVWLLDCLQKRFPFRMLPLLPPKRMAVNGNHLSNDGSFIEKRRRGLARFLNALVRHPVLGQEQLVIMFLTVPTVRNSHWYILDRL
jgi:sorting nexin-8